MRVPLSLKIRKAKADLPLHVFEHLERQVVTSHYQSMKLLSENGLRPLTYQEALSRPLELIAKLEGKWFYLDGNGIPRGADYTFNSKGELAESTGKEPADQRVRVWSGDPPLLLEVNFDADAQRFGRRFYISGNLPNVYLTPVVVGVPDPEAKAKSIITEGSAALNRLRRNSL